MAGSMERWYAVQKVLIEEARLLDEREWDAWLDMLLPEAEYWMPYEWRQDSASDHVSHLGAHPSTDYAGAAW